MAGGHGLEIVLKDRHVVARGDLAQGPLVHALADEHFDEHSGALFVARQPAEDCCTLALPAGQHAELVVVRPVECAGEQPRQDGHAARLVLAVHRHGCGRDGLVVAEQVQALDGGARRPLLCARPGQPLHAQRAHGRVGPGVLFEEPFNVALAAELFQGLDLDLQHAHALGGLVLDVIAAAPGLALAAPLRAGPPSPVDGDGIRHVRPDQIEQVDEVACRPAQRPHGRLVVAGKVAIAAVAGECIGYGGAAIRIRRTALAEARRPLCNGGAGDVAVLAPGHLVDVGGHCGGDLPVYPRRLGRVATLLKAGGRLHYPLEINLAVVVVPGAPSPPIPIPGVRLGAEHGCHPAIVVQAGHGRAPRAPREPLGKARVAGHLGREKLPQVPLAGAVEHPLDRRGRLPGLADHSGRVVLDMQQRRDDVLALPSVRVGAGAVVVPGGPAASRPGQRHVVLFGALDGGPDLAADHPGRRDEPGAVVVDAALVRPLRAHPLDLGERQVCQSHAARSGRPDKSLAVRRPHRAPPASTYMPRRIPMEPCVCPSPCRPRPTWRGRPLHGTASAPLMRTSLQAAADLALAVAPTGCIPVPATASRNIHTPAKTGFGTTGRLSCGGAAQFRYLTEIM